MKRILTLTIVLFSITAFAQKTYIHCGKLIDVEKGKVLEDMTVIVVGERILSVEKGFSQASSGDIVIDLKSKTVMPGLMDMHVHIESQYDKGTRGALESDLNFQVIDVPVEVKFIDVLNHG